MLSRVFLIVPLVELFPGANNERYCVKGQGTASPLRRHAPPKRSKPQPRQTQRLVAKSTSVILVAVILIRSFKDFWIEGVLLSGSLTPIANS